ncbi:MAG: HAD-IC family P-type ATPase [Parcubacteria group bacterium]|nr:HAD-IC family P-type ATPase [Parcubacteria group bacterium]
MRRSKNQKQNNALEQTLWYRLDRKEVLLKLRSKPGGLTTEDVKSRRAVHGENRLPAPPLSPAWRLVLTQFASPLVFILLAAAVISALVGDAVDVGVILAAMLINAIVGFWQEYKADRAVARLKNIVEHHVTVQRDGRQQRIAAHELVAGDILLLEAGDKVGADARLLEVNRLQTAEASLTGESSAVEKMAETLGTEAPLGERKNMVYMGTTVLRGNGRAVVVQTGTSTEIGRVATLVKVTKEERTSLQTQIIHLSRLLCVLVLATALALALIGWWRGLDPSELLVVIAALAVAAVPEGLLISLTIVLVIGMQRILRQRGLVRRLVAAETLGSVTVVCSDKTGTLTKGEMQVARIVVEGEAHDNHEHADDRQAIAFEEQHLFVLKAAALCNNAYIKNPQDELRDWEVVGDQTEAALLLAAVQGGFDRERLNNEHPRLDEIPFNETYKFMATLHHVNEREHMVFAKGAPETILAMCSQVVREGEHQPATAQLRLQLQEECQLLASQGLRVLAVAFRPVGNKVESFDGIVKDRERPQITDLVFAGWVGLKDPVRPEIKGVFAAMRGAGVRPVIVTGDHPFTVQAVVAEVGWNVGPDRVLTGLELDRLSEKELLVLIRHIDIFARVEPKHKVRIVQAFRAAGEVVAMFGDGVNDAPALKAADIGVAVNAGTDIAKDVSDLLLLDNHFGVITAAIREGRVMFDNIRRIFLFLVSDSFAEVIVIALAMLFVLPIPLTAIQILWMNLVSDTFPNLALTLERATDDVMSRQPRPKGTPIVNREIAILITVTTLAAGLTAFILYYYLLKTTGDVERSRTVVFAITSLDSLFYAISIRHLQKPLWRMPFFSNPTLLAAILLSFCLQLVVVYTPFLQPIFDTVALGWFDWLLIFAAGIFQIAAIEFVKARFMRKPV